MPSPNFIINYKPGDFFYDTINPENNADVLASFPFSKESVIKWANKVANPNPPINQITDIFDPQISTIIINEKYDFKNTFLPGNITFNSNFNNLTLSLTGSSVNGSTDGGSSFVNDITPQIAGISGNIVIQSNGQPTTLEINKGNDSNIQWKQDATNAWQPTFDINTALSQEIPFTDVDGGQSTVIMTSNNPRCKYRKTCTMNHWHYSGPCNTQITTASDGSTTCKCICTGVPVFNSEPHSHCDSYNINPDGTVTTPLGGQSAPEGIGLIAAIQGMKMNLTANFPQSSFFSDFYGGDSPGSPGSKISLPFNESEALKKNEELIRQMIFNYYKEVNQNIELQKKIQAKGNKEVSASQALTDANVKYKTEYLNVFNTVAGIFGVAGYIYLVGQT
jgi:hypothetical protein